DVSIAEVFICLSNGKRNIRLLHVIPPHGTLKVPLIITLHRLHPVSKQFAEEVLRSHNEYRRSHQAPPLKLSSKLSREAARYAESLASTRILKHSVESSRGSCGENLAWASYDQPVVLKLPNMPVLYPPSPQHGPHVYTDPGHFTAMVWKSTTKLGVGKATASDGSSFVVARYFPAGNVTNKGHFDSNVLPAKTTTATP
uniref:GLI pathogenesis-related 2, like n=1 Tax=Gadus morhua TaxID=8049 RepID=A0A8C5A521_GADMO